MCCFFSFIHGLSAQQSDAITVKAGSRIQDCMSFHQRYQYPGFVDGKVFFKNGAYADAKLNYNFLPGDMEFIKSGDTLSIADADEILMVAVANDTFFFGNGYLQLIRGGPVKVAMKQYYEQQKVLKKDSYGMSGSNSATDSYSLIQSEGKSAKLISSQNRVFEKKTQYFVAVRSFSFVAFDQKRVMKLFAEHKAAIQAYLKEHKVDFGCENDLQRFAGYLSSL